MFCDSMSAVNNVIIPTSALKKRHNAICYHKFIGDQDAGILRIGWIPEEFNLADLSTKSTMPENTSNNLVGSIFFNTASPIDDIEKSWVNLYMGESNYLPHYNSSCGKWSLGMHIYILFKSNIYGCQFAGTR